MLSQMYSTHIGLHVKYRYFSQSLMKLEFSPQIFENYSIKFYKNHRVGAELFLEDGRTDGQTERQTWRS